MIIDVATVLLLIIVVVGFAKVYLDWSGFERRVRRANLVDSSEARKIATKIATTSAITGLALGLLGVVLQLSSPPSGNEEAISGVLYVAPIALCTIGWWLFALLMFGLKVLALRSVYRPPE